MASPAPGSTLGIGCGRVLFLDGGTQRIGIVAREGDETREAAVVSPPKPIEDLTASEWVAYWLDGVNTAEDMHERCFGGDDDVLVGVEDAAKPKSVERRDGKKGKLPNRIPDRHWVPLFGLIGTVIGRYPDAIVLPRCGLSDRHQRNKGGTGDPFDYFDAILAQRRWTVGWRNDDPSNAKGEALTAYHGAGELWLLVQRMRAAA